MKVYIDSRVYQVLQDFYDKSIDRHPALDYETVIRKTIRLEQAMYDFAEYAEIFHTQPYRKDWHLKGYFEFVHEDFHFAYKVYCSTTGEKIVIYHDACHSLLNYNPEDAINTSR